MKNRVLIILSILVAASINAAAQYIPQNATLYYKAGNVYTTDGDVKLTKANALNYFSSLDDYENYWLKGKRLFTAGIVVSSVGAGLALGGYHSSDVCPHSVVCRMDFRRSDAGGKYTAVLGRHSQVEKSCCDRISTKSGI